MTVSLPAVDGLEDQGPTPLPRHVWLAFSMLLFAAAVGPNVIREAQLVGLPSLYIITMRLGITSAVLTPFVLRSKKAELQALTRRDGLLVLAGGTLLAINLIMLFLALEYTSVLVTTVLRRTSPLWVIWLEIILLGFTLQHPPVHLLAQAHPGLIVTGGRANRARASAEQFRQHGELAQGIEAEIELAIPSHMGLSSEPILGLAMARG